MDFKSFVDMIDVMTCIISVETKDDGSSRETLPTLLPSR